MSADGTSSPSEDRGEQDEQGGGSPGEAADAREAPPDAGPEPLPDFSESVQFFRRARGGDPDAVGLFLERYRDRLERILRIELGHGVYRHFDFEDIFQEVYFVVRRRISEFEPHSQRAFLAWLVTIAKRRIKDLRARIKAGKRDPGREIPLDDTRVPEVAGSTTDPGSRAGKRELREAMDVVVESALPEDHRRVILLRDYYGADWEEIARELERTKHACQQLHQRAWIRLRLEIMKKLRGR